jgi:hypothetical protein
VRELRNLRSFGVNHPRFFGGHLGFECSRCGRLDEPGDGTNPLLASFLGGTLLAQRTMGAGCFGCAINACAHTIAAIQHSPAMQDFARRTGKAIALGIVRKSASLKSTVASLGVAFTRPPAILPRAVKIHSMRSGSLYGCVVGVVSIGHKLLRLTAKRLLASFDGWP